MKNIIISGSGLVLVALTAALSAAACGGSSGGDTSGGGGTGGSSTGSDTTSTTSTSSPTTSTSTTSPSTTSTTTTTTTTSSGGMMVAPGLIDDMEDKDGAIITAEGRQGYWYSYSDGTGTMTPDPKKGFTMTAITPPREASTSAAHMAGMGFTMYGGGMGFDLNAMGTTKSGYDASGYSGVTFFARIGKGASAALRVNISDKDTAPEGGVCNNAKGKCNDFHGQDITLTEDWKQYTIKFTDLKQQGYGDPFPKLLTTALYGMSFAVGTKVTFDVWIDDITFIK